MEFLPTKPTHFKDGNEREKATRQTMLQKTTHKPKKSTLNGTTTANERECQVKNTAKTYTKKASMTP